MTGDGHGAEQQQAQLRAFGRRVLELLDGARKALTFYPPDHPLVVTSFEQLEYLLGDLFLGAHELTLTVIDDEFYLNDLSLKRESAGFRKLADHLQARQATGLTLFPAVTADELRRVFVELHKSAEEIQAAGGAAAVTDRLNVTNIRLSHVTATETAAPPDRDELDEDLQAELDEARGGYDDAVANMRWVFDCVADDAPIDYRTVKTTIEALLDSVVTNRYVWAHLLNVKHNDEYTYYHSVNVTTLALLFATRFGVRPESLEVLGEAALLHDLGKQKVPAEILQKPAALTDDEWVVMRSHPEKGAKILLGMRDVSEAAVMVAYEHHIRYDHKGYPPTRKPRSLHLFSHLVAVADIYDALTSDRGYRKALLPDMAMRIILTQSGTAFHPLVVKHFVNLVGVFPVGTFVALKTGEVALVQLNQSRDLLRPVVLVVYDRDGRAVTPVSRDLAAGRDPEPPIRSCVDPAALGLDLSADGGVA